MALRRLLFICKGEYRYLFPAIARVLCEQYEVEPWAVVFNTPAERLLNQLGCFEGVFNLASHIKREAARLNVDSALEVLRDFESTSGFPNSNLLLFADRIISGYPFEQGLKVLAALPGFWRSVLSDAKPDLVLGEVSTAAEWMGWCYAAQRGVRQIIPYPPPMSGRLYFIDAPEGDWRDMAERYERSKRVPLTLKESSRAEEFLRTYRERRPKPAYISWDERSPMYVFHPQRLIPRIARMPFRFRTWFEDGFSEVGSYHGTPPWQPILGAAAAIARHIRAGRTMFAWRLDGGPKMYYSLHAQPEFTVDVRAPFYRNQLALIENIAKSLPIGYRLIVKDHPSMKGERPLEFYRQLKSLPNVQLVSPSMDSHELIAQCDLVFTINGSVAWEAILYEKPVIVFGALCYGFFEKIVRCENPVNLPTLVQDTLRQFRPDRGMLLRFITAYLETVIECDWGGPTRMASITSEGNIAKLASVIAGEIPGSSHETRQAQG